jgi:putative ABC transport system permease protein
VLAETTTSFTSEIDLVGNILLGFGGLALFVSMFIIYNTFGIVMNQRTRELALLRTIGAEPRQIRRSVRAESFAIGALASAGGIAGGIGVAKGLDALFAASGAKLADYPLIVAPRTIIAAVAIGVGVTMLAAMGPARRAANTPPIVALTGAGEPKVGESRRRMVAGFGVLGAGILAGAAGLSGVGSTAVTVAALAAGAMAIFVGATLLSPLAVPAITTLFGLPMRAMAGVAATLAQKNANRHARRTATTAAALMIGLTLVTTALLVGSSIKSTFGAAISHASKADYIVSDELDDVDFPATLTQQLRDSDGVAAAAGFTSFQARIDGHVVDAVGVDFDQVGGLVDFGVRSGGFDATAINPVVVADHTAKARNAHVGDTIVIEVANGRKVDATITGTFHDQAVVSEDYLFDTSVLAAVGMDATPQWLAVSLVDGASRAQVDAFLASVTSEYPYATVETAAAFSKRIQGNIDQLLTMVNLLVALAVIIALIGIANTLALSVFERTRELGLIRAVGMSRRQLRRMVRLEAALVATFGATLGVGLGLLFGWGVIAALPSSLATVTSVPVQQILVLVLVAAGAGVTAAWLPARRAGRLDVLQAIAL